MSEKELEDSKIVNHFSGKSGDYEDEAYITRTQDKIFCYNEWLKIEMFVCVDCIVYNETDKEVLDLKEKIVKQDNRIDMLVKERVELKEQFKSVLEYINFNKQIDSIQWNIKELKEQNEIETNEIKELENESNRLETLLSKLESKHPNEKYLFEKKQIKDINKEIIKKYALIDEVKTDITKFKNDIVKLRGKSFEFDLKL